MSTSSYINVKPSSIDEIVSRRPFLGFVVGSVLGVIVSSGTSSNIFFPPEEISAPRLKTDAGQLLPTQQSHTGSLTELRQLTGLTWEQIASLFEVSRRAVHFWANGKPMSASHFEHLERSLSCLKMVDRGVAASNRKALFERESAREAPFDLLVAKKYDAFVAAMGKSAKQFSRARPRVKIDMDRRPPSLETMIGSIEEPIQSQPAARRVVRVNKVT